MPTPRPLEITDVVGFSRLPRDRADAEAELRARGQNRAARIVATLPTEDGRLTARAMGQRLGAVYRELQRLEEELQVPRLVAAKLGPTIHALRPGTGAKRVRILDIGCGLGYVSRWLARHQPFGDHVDVVGVDLDGMLVRQARRLAESEGVTCAFREQDALDLAGDHASSRTVVISTGFLHHLSPEELVNFFRRQAQAGVAAFAHWDLTPSPWARVGAWVYHLSRARDPITRHDGVLSAARAHHAADLLSIAQSASDEYSLMCRDGNTWLPNPLRVLRPLIGIRRPLGDPA